MVKKVGEFAEARESPIEGMGLFATADIAEGKNIVEYLGEKISREEGDKRSDAQEAAGKPMVIFELTDDLDLDASVGGSGAEFANHSCDPNAESENIKGHIYLIATRDIKAGEEICYDYNFESDAEFQRCLCASPNCRGSINRVKGAKKHRRKKLEKTLTLSVR